MANGTTARMGNPSAWTHPQPTTKSVRKRSSAPSSSHSTTRPPNLHIKKPRLALGEPDGETECEKGKQSQWIHGTNPTNDTTVI
nr:MAG TPA_asm: hypothetical protein [Caudoviricetes sp.]